VNPNPTGGVPDSMRPLRLLAAVLLAIGLVTGCSRSSDGPVITIKESTFTGDLTVAPGVTVTVRNEDTVAHTLTAADETFSTGTIDPGKSGTFVAPSGIGAHAIGCRQHPRMVGTLTVGNEEGG
jgi:hypothetical protein